MDFVGKAKVRLEHWLTHNHQHLEEYEDFARQLESSGKSESAKHIREMMDHVARSTECMRKALEALN